MEPDPGSSWTPAADAAGVAFFLSNGIAFVLLLLASALASGSEVAFFSLSQDERYRLRESDDAAERRIFRLLENPQLLLATILIVKNLLDITLVVMTAVATKRLLGDGAEALAGVLIPVGLCTTRGRAFT